MRRIMRHPRAREKDRELARNRQFVVESDNYDPFPRGTPPMASSSAAIPRIEQFDGSSAPGRREGRYRALTHTHTHTEQGRTGKRRTEATEERRRQMASEEPEVEERNGRVMARAGRQRRRWWSRAAFKSFTGLRLSSFATPQKASVTVFQSRDHTLARGAFGF